LVADAVEELVTVPDIDRVGDRQQVAHRLYAPADLEAPPPLDDE